ncbi:MarR family winged helix-turn-helix transcriptional regulator [Cohnella sp. REN36]|uniref:MarR family winged helix-turn-helix transcriptional regulator n=1 Tax=Cohnella sp. REN36 TaxID=2887347 RepID=UPI001D142445|nr:MarR family transcriptional regulator [Cohnella sp. REN36]MCC3375373.1 MarR family transcriptional regulator [Cohnella sp. REN36]
MNQYSDPKVASSPGVLLEALFKSSHIIHRQLAERLSESEIPSYLTGPRMRFLRVVLHAGEIRMSDLAAELGIKARTVTQFVDALEQENVIVRIPDPDDRRATLIRVVDEAKPIIKKTAIALREAADAIASAMSEEKRTLLIELLTELAGSTEPNLDILDMESY